MVLSFFGIIFLCIKSRLVCQLQHHQQAPGRWEGRTEEGSVVEEGVGGGGGEGTKMF